MNTRRIFPLGGASVDPNYDGFPLIDDRLWNATDSEENYNRIFPKINKYINWRWNNEKITYSTNNCGLRMDENIDDDYDFSNTYVVLGCSFVEGIGNKKEETISAYIEKTSGIKTLNFGNGGTGCDVVFYNSMWLASRPNPPKKIFINWPVVSRFSHYNLSYNEIKNKIETDSYFTKPIHPITITNEKNTKHPYKDSLFAYPNVQATNKLLWQEILRCTWGGNLVELDILDSSEFNRTYDKTTHEIDLGVTCRSNYDPEELINFWCARDIQMDTIDRIIKKGYKTGGACHWGPAYNKLISDWFLSQ